MSGLDISIKENKYQLYGLVTLRVLIGWHFLYEGIAKLINPYWSSAAYLLDSKWIFSGLAKEYGLDLIQGTIKTMVNEGLMQSDGIHPNVLGHQQIENIIWERLNKYLEK